ncbi:hypothetical protein [Spiroplasma poulsonii]|uniref:hypothetical protein n=1 Tax=Spiroplasma poulsonii TaxID=2138 RepID=UPI001331BC9D|nr:hypothetical protein [Spiroplasma poulsonii]KAF0849981.1 putative chitinase-like [Spiroplasma poulsonii]
MKKLLSILTITTLTANVPAPLLANTPLTRNKRDVGATKTDVNTRVIKTDGANKPTAHQIKNILKELNLQLDITKINVTNITNNSATITSTEFSGSRTLNFKVDKSIDLKKIIINIDLGSIITDGINLPTIEQIKDKLKELNLQLDITKINVTKIANNNAAITSNDENIYTKNVIVNYTISIKSFIRNTDLGSIITDGINLPTIEQIKDKLKKLNNKLKDVKFHFLLKI